MSPSSRVLRARSAPAAAPALAELETPVERFEREASAGWAHGYEAGLKAAEDAVAARLAEADRLVAHRSHQLTSSLAALEACVAEARAAVARRAADSVAGIGQLVCDLAEAVLGRELAADPAPVITAVHRAAASMPDTPATVAVHPEDLETARAGAAGRGLLEFVADPAVEPGGCVLRAESATVDAQIRTALARARAAFDEAVA